MPIPNTKLFLADVVTGPGGYRFLPEVPGDFLSTFAAGPFVTGIADLTGDLIPDIAIAEPGSDDKANNAGRIFVIPGAAGGGTSQLLGDVLTAKIIDGVNAGDQAGAALGTIADLNGDGKAELLIGAPGVDATAKLDTGAAYVLFGKAGTAGVDLADVAAGGGGFIIRGEAAGDAAGTAVAAVSDLNGDGKADILVAAALNDGGGKTDAGAVYLVFGKSSGTAVNLSSVAAGTGGFKIFGEGTHDNAGSSIGSVADLNGDGKAELLIGAAGSEAGGKDSGAAYVVFGKATGTTVDLSNVASGAGGFRITGQAGDRAGDAISGIGDVNGDGKADILVGAANGDHVYVVFGKATTGEVLLANVAQGIGGFMVTPEASGDLTGMSIAGGGDFNHDGIADFVIGAPHDAEGGFDAGAVYIVWGGGSGNVDLSLVAQGIGGAKLVGTAGSLAGSSVAIIGDQNGDAAPDLLIGSTGTGHQSAIVVHSDASWQPEVNIYGTSGDDVMGAGYGGAHKIGSGDDAILGLAGNDTISAGAGNDAIEGGDGNDVIDGGAGNDLIDGGTGADVMTGGGGDDSYVVDDAGDTTIEAAGGGTDTVQASINCTLAANVENLVLTGDGLSGTGNAAANVITAAAGSASLFGLGGTDTLIGGTGDDLLDGGTGADRMTGGQGNDSYAVDNSGDVVTEAAGEGTDTVTSTINYTLGANLENLALTGSARIGTGNELDNILTGTAGADTLDGKGGADILNGGAGNDIYYVDNGSDLTGEAAGGGTDKVIASIDYTLGANVERLELVGSAHHGTGNGDANTLVGTAGADVLDGAGGADLMVGGAGNDTYMVDNSGDVARELAGGGTDTVIASADYTIGANVEALVLTGAAHHGIGNTLDNSLTGGTGNDILDGKAGADTMTGSAGDDTYYVDIGLDKTVEAAGGGTDTVIASRSWTLGDNLENLVLTGAATRGNGNAQDNHITGGSNADLLYGLGGNDTLDGGLGADTMVGGAGNDTYYIDNTGDVASEKAGDGTDTAIVSIDHYTVGLNIENVQLTGAAHVVTGGAGSNELIGGAGNDTIDGAAGDDTEIGGAGNDALISGSGHDVLAGGAGDDVYKVHGGSAHIEDTLGYDTIDASEATGDSHIDLSGETESEVEGEICDIGNGGSTALPLDVQFLQDRTGSFADDIANVRALVPQIVAALDAVQVNNEFGVSSFVDKPVSPFGATGEWVYRLEQSMSPDTAALATTYNNIFTLNGLDTPESQIEALMQLALHGSEVGFRSDSARFVVLFTDAPFHVAGDGAAAGITTPNNGDGVLDGLIPGTGEDYPMVAQLKAALDAANIIPIFAIAGGFESTYQDLATQLGRGEVVTLTSDSSNVVAAITAGLTAATTTVIEDAAGGAGNDTLTGNDVDNMLTGNAGNDTLLGGLGNDVLNGGAGNDHLDGGAGADKLIGGAGDDSYVVDNIGDVVADPTGGGHDSVLTTLLSYTLGATIEDLSFGGVGDVIGNGNALANVITGGDGNDTLRGADGDDTLIGGLGDDTLTGGNGADTLQGGLGNDVLAGGVGQDVMTGGGGADRFLFKDGEFGGATQATADRITDFAHSDLDRINLAGVDANVALAGDQAFSFIGTGAFTSVAGQLHVTAGLDGNSYVSGDTNGDGLADFMIRLDGAQTLVAADFVL